MSHPNSLRKFGSLILVGLICALLSWKAQPGGLAFAGNPGLASAKIDPIVLNQIDSYGATDFFLVLSEKADLSATQDQSSKADKGALVLERLTDIARRTQSGLRAFLDSRGIDYQSYYIANLVLVRQGNLALLQELAARPEVARINPNGKHQLLGLDLADPGLESPPAAPELEQPADIEPNLTFINADDVWAMGYTGQGMVLAGMDTGLEVEHPAIARHYRGCVDPPDCTEWDHNYNWWDANGEYPNEPHDGNGHGTMTTGVMVGNDGGENQIGVAPGAQTIHCKAFTAGGSGSDEDILECLQWFLAPWDLNGENPEPAMAPDALAVFWNVYPGGYDIYQTAFNALQSAGILVAASIGANGPACMTVGSPGDYSNLLTIGGVDGWNFDFPGELMSISSRGPALGQPSPPYFPDSIAPGVHIRSSNLNGSYQVWDGISLPTSHAPGVAALCWSANPALRGDIVTTMDLIMEAAAPLSGKHYSDCGGDYETGPNNDWGSGTIDALATVLACLPEGPFGTLQGEARDALLETPLVGATVSALPEGGSAWETLTDVSGFYSLTLPTGVYTVTALRPGYLPSSITGVEVLTDTITEQDFALSPGVSFAPSPVEMTLEWLTSGELPVTLTSQLDEPFAFTFAETPDGGTPGEDVPWLGQSPNGGTIPAGGSLTASLLFSATIESGISLPGDYSATLLVEGDASLEIPVSLHVTGEAIAPAAAFTVTLPACPSPNTVQFYNDTQPGNPPETDYLWDFGDGSSSSDENPYHTYAGSGAYTVELTACNDIGCTTSSLPVEVLPPPTAGFAYSVDHLTVAFSNTSTNGDSFLWDFGDGTYSNEMNPIHWYSEAGDYQVTLTVTGSCGEPVFSDLVSVAAYRQLLPLLVKIP